MPEVPTNQRPGLLLLHSFQLVLGCPLFLRPSKQVWSASAPWTFFYNGRIRVPNPLIHSFLRFHPCASNLIPIEPSDPAASSPVPHFHTFYSWVKHRDWRTSRSWGLGNESFQRIGCRLLLVSRANSALRTNIHIRGPVINESQSHLKILRWGHILL